ncbi:hypothetical protein [Streptomyces spinosisporus]|uniref:Uncharacterized protein n=1 Tax=Streptomyces spinosisporus TaxID=2927582 RepID=A0ABS9XW48_9ACTN|nr:hypothetical protein [Streptomyces spinosisporus]MCI3246308.1 hypothetical protein [Streptomyces spinosisporus]
MWAIQEDTPHGQLLSYNGKTLVHDNRAELEFLLTGPVRIVLCPPSLRPEDCMEIRFHPQFSHHQFPLVRSNYR